MLAIYLVVVAILVGGIASRGNARSAFLYIPVALLGAIVGAFSALGNSPIFISPSFMRFPAPILLSLLGSVAFTAIVWVWKKRGEKR